MLLRQTLRCAVAAFFLGVVAACLEPELQVRFEIPSQYLEQIAQSSLQVLEPPRAQPFTCTALAFREVEEELQRLSLTQEVFALDGGVDLSGIDRRSDKLLLAQAWTDDGELAVAGCAELGRVEESTTVAIEGRPAAWVALRSPLPADGTPPEALSLALLDVLDRPLAAVRVRWRLASAGGLVASSEQPSDSAGLVELELPPPEVPGPAMLRIAARWHAGAPLRIAGFEPPQVVEVEYTSSEIGPPMLDPGQVGRLGPGGLTAYVFLGDCTAQPGQLCSHHIRFGGASGTLVHEEQSPSLALVMPGTIPTCLVRGPQSDRVALVTDTELHLFDGDSGWSAQPLAVTLMDPPAAEFDISGCEPEVGDETALLLHTGLQYRIIDLSGASAVADFTELPSWPETPVAAGCVAMGEGEPQLLLVADDGAGGLHYYARAGEIADAPYGIAPPLRFVPEVGSDLSPRLLATRLGGAGLQLSMLELRSAGTAPSLMEVEAYYFGWLPEALFGGDLDGDARLDLCGLARANIMSPEWIAGIVLAGEVAGERLAADLPLGDHASRPDLAVADLDGDGVDDLLVRTVASPGPPEESGTTTLRLFRMGVTAR